MPEVPSRPTAEHSDSDTDGVEHAPPRVLGPLRLARDAANVGFGAAVLAARGARRLVGRTIAEPSKVIDDTTRAAASWMVDRVDLSGIVVETTGGAAAQVLRAVRAAAASADERVDGVVAKVLHRPVATAPPEVAYAPTGPPSLGVEGPVRLGYAGLVSRAFALAVDAVAVVVGYYGFVGIAVLVRALVTLEMPRAFEPEDWVWALTFAAWAAVYLSASWWAAGRTPGQALFGLRVVTTDGRRLGVVRAGLRVVGYVLSATAAGLGFAWAAVSRRRRGWPDLLAGSCVIHAGPAARVAVTRRKDAA